jgi:dTDP-4-dehydrorhamnose reductase
MRVAITGCRGQLGRELVTTATDPLLETYCTDVEEMDITSPDQIDAALTKFNPQVIINAAAYTRVDAAESESELAFAVNATAPALLADWCRRSGAFLVHISTDYVFSGRKGEAYIESDATDPISVYGASKARGERLVRERLPHHLIVRTSWLYSIHGQNFVKTVLALCRKMDVLRIVADQYGSPTNAADLAKGVWSMIAHMDRHADGPWGTYHFCSRGVASWHDFATEIVRLRSLPTGGRQVRVEAITTADYPTAAARPTYSVLDCSKLEANFGCRPPEWREALRPVVQSLTGTAA